MTNKQRATLQLVAHRTLSGANLLDVEEVMNKINFLRYIPSVLMVTEPTPSTHDFKVATRYCSLLAHSLEHDARQADYDHTVEMAERYEDY